MLFSILLPSVLISTLLPRSRGFSRMRLHGHPAWPPCMATLHGHPAWRAMDMHACTCMPLHAQHAYACHSPSSCMPPGLRTPCRLPHGPCMAPAWPLHGHWPLDMPPHELHGCMPWHPLNCCACPGIPSFHPHRPTCLHCISIALPLHAFCRPPHAPPMPKPT